MTTRQLTALIEREGDGYVSLCPELDIASQGETVEHANRNLQEAIELFFEAASPSEISERLHGEVYVTSINVAVGKQRLGESAGPLRSPAVPHPCGSRF